MARVFVRKRDPDWVKPCTVSVRVLLAEIRKLQHSFRVYLRAQKSSGPLNKTILTV